MYIFVNSKETYQIPLRNRFGAKMLLMRDKRQALADWIRSERLKKDWSQSDLADRMGKVRAVINKMESGSNDATLETLSSLAKAFGYPLTVVLNVIGYDVNLENNDQWLEGMNHKIGLLSPSRRPMAEKLLNALLEEDKPIVVSKKARAAKG